MKRWATGIWIVGCLLTLAALRLGTAHWEEVRSTAATTLAREQAGRVAAREYVSKLEPWVLEAERDVAALRSSLATTRSAPPPTSASQPEAPDRHAALERDPVYQNALLAYQRTDLRLRFAPLFAELNLTAEQVDAFVHNHATNEERLVDLRAAAEEQGLALGDASLRPLWEKGTRDYLDAQKALLGPEGYAAWREFERERVPRQLAQGFAGAAALAGVPLHQTPPEAVVQAMRAAAAPERRSITMMESTGRRRTRRSKRFCRRRSLRSIVRPRRSRECPGSRSNSIA